MAWSIKSLDHHLNIHWLGNKEAKASRLCFLVVRPSLWNSLYVGMRLVSPLEHAGRCWNETAINKVIICSEQHLFLFWCVYLKSIWLIVVRERMFQKNHVGRTSQGSYSIKTPGFFSVQLIWLQHMKQGLQTWLHLTVMYGRRHPTMYQSIFLILLYVNELQ